MRNVEKRAAEMEKRAAEMDFEVRVSASAMLKNLLAHYPSGGQFIFEALQNAEDCDRVACFRAVLDLRSHRANGIRPATAA